MRRRPNGELMMKLTVAILFAITVFLSGVAAHADAPDLTQQHITIDPKPPAPDKKSPPLYPEATKVNIVHALYRMGVLDFSDPRLVDDYLRLKECALYNAFHNDDFKWEQIRDATRAQMKRDASSYPLGLTITGKIRFDRYDFVTKQMILGVSTKIDRINSFVLTYIGNNECKWDDLEWMPREYIAVLDKAITLDGLSMPASLAETIFLRMKAEGNEERMARVRFNLRLVAADPIMPTGRRIIDKKRFYYIHSILESIEFYEDADMQRLIAAYEP